MDKINCEESVNTETVTVPEIEIDTGINAIPPKIDAVTPLNNVNTSDNVNMSTVSSKKTASKLEKEARIRSAKEANLDKLTEADLELKEFKCPRCSKKFPSTNDLFNHMREVYENPTKCHLCDKQLRCMANILSHSYLHSGERPYKCPNCDYATRTRFNLRVHLGSCAGIEKFAYYRSGGKKGESTVGGEGGRRGSGANATKKKKQTRKRKATGANGNGGPKRKKRKVTEKKKALMVDRSGSHDNMTHNVAMMIGNSMAHDLMYLLKDAGEAPRNRNESCMIQIHISSIPNTSSSKQPQTSHMGSSSAYYSNLPPEHEHSCSTQQQPQPWTSTVAGMNMQLPPAI